MRFFALETDLRKTVYSLKGRDEPAILFVQRHWMPLVFAVLRAAASLAACVAVVLLLRTVGVEAPWSGVPILAWLAWAAVDGLRAYIDWRYTFLFMTAEKLVFVEQHLWTWRRLTPITLNNVLSVTVESQFWELFPFGSLCVHLRDPNLTSIVFRYAPRPQRIARKIAKVVTSYNRNRSQAPDPVLRAVPTVFAPASAAPQ